MNKITINFNGFTNSRYEICNKTPPRVRRNYIEKKEKKKKVINELRE